MFPVHASPSRPCWGCPPVAHLPGLLRLQRLMLITGACLHLKTHTPTYALFRLLAECRIFSQSMQPIPPMLGLPSLLRAHLATCASSA
jgi:hypothetical protein